MNNLDTFLTDEVVCPYCGYEFECSNELFRRGLDSAEMDCENPYCEKRFEAYINVSVSYSTYAKDEAKDL